MKKDECPNYLDHTPEPAGYMSWHSWAKTKSKTHKQIRCKSCGLYAVWIPKANKLLK